MINRFQYTNARDWRAEIT